MTVARLANPCLPPTPTPHFYSHRPILVSRRFVSRATVEKSKIIIIAYERRPIRPRRAVRLRDVTTINVMVAIRANETEDAPEVSASSWRETGSWTRVSARAYTISHTCAAAHSDDIIVRTYSNISLGHGPRRRGDGERLYTVKI